MSEENVARYRVPPVRSSPRRTFVQRVNVSFPHLGRLFGAALLRLPLRSRLRRELLARAIRDGAEAYNRRDREVLLATADPDVEFNILGEFAVVDTPDRYHGHEGVRRYFAAIDEAWETARLEPQEVIDFWDRYLVLQRTRNRGRGSGAEVERETGLFLTYSRGMLVRADFYWSRDEALEAAGLSE
jgi:ketosteroid isomerase-like protein